MVSTVSSKYIPKGQQAAVLKAQEQANEAKSIWDDGDILDGGAISEFIKKPTIPKAKVAVKKNWGLVALIGFSVLLTIKKQIK